MNVKLERILHRNMAILGGFMAGYAIITRCEVMGNAQTMNLTQFVIALLGHNWLESFWRLLVIVFYFLGGFLFVVCKHTCARQVHMISISIDAAALLMLGLMPAALFPVVALYPVFFSMAFQWNAFPGYKGYVSSTIFSTNNVRQVSLALGEYIFDRDRKHLEKTAFFLGSLIHFHVGVAISYFATRACGVRGAWIGWIILIPAVIFALREMRQKAERE